MGIEEIKARIVEEARAEAERLLASARARAAEELEKARASAREEAARIVGAAEAEARRIEERARVEAGLERQKARADLEGRLLREVFARARARLFSLPKDELEPIVIGAILAAEPRGTEEVRFCGELKKLATAAFVGRLNKQAAARGLPAHTFTLGAGRAERADIELAGDGYLLLVSVSDEFENMDAATRASILDALLEERGA